MKALRTTLAVAIGCCLVAPNLSAYEIIKKQYIENGTLKKEMLVRVADNGVFLLDTSSSTNREYGDTGKPLVELMREELISRNAWFPDLQHNIGIYTYTGWQTNYALAPYNREAVGKALEGVRSKGKGATPLLQGLINIDKKLEGTKGRTAIFVFWDGEATNNPVKAARILLNKHDACFYVISGAKKEREAEMAKNITDLNACSRVIPLSDFFMHPEYTSGALWDVKTTEHPIPQSPLNFTFNGTELDANDEKHLDDIAAFLAEHPGTKVVAAGYTDDVGTKAYNEELSRRRAQMVGDYLDTKGVDESRVVLLWYGLSNPLVPNDSAENRAKNRRVEVKVDVIE